MTEIEATTPIRKMAQHPDAPPMAILGVELIEQLITLTLEHKPLESAELSTSICNNPKIANAVLAMAIGALCHIEQSLQSASQTLDSLEADSPEAVAAIKVQVGRQFGINPEDVELRRG